MYEPPHHREDNLDAQQDLIERHPLGLLISVGPDGIEANPIPFLLDRKAGRFGTLEAHMARANVQWKSLDGEPVLAVFQGPQSYVSPSFYATKGETGKVVPTWNYTMVQVRGVARLRSEPAWLSRQIAALTDVHENGRAKPWKVDDAPSPFIESQLRGIVGIEIEIKEIAGKWKVSQNRPETDRRGVAEGLALECPGMSDLVRRYGSI